MTLAPVVEDSSWEYIHSLLGPGLHWGKSQKELLKAIDLAVANNKPAAAEHLRIILKRRNAVMMEKTLLP